MNQLLIKGNIIYRDESSMKKKSGQSVKLHILWIRMSYLLHIYPDDCLKFLTIDLTSRLFGKWATFDRRLIFIDELKVVSQWVYMDIYNLITLIRNLTEIF